jgi:hypothetical protein
LKTRTWIYLACIVAAATVLWRLGVERPTSPRLGGANGAAAAQQAFDHRVSGIVLTVPGRVTRILAEDSRPPRHQRFIIRTARGQTLLVAHNVDLARRAPVRLGDDVTVRGKYEWNDQGGVLHDTHFQPRGPSGWIRVAGRARRLHPP